MVQQWINHASSIMTIFMQIDAQSKILWDFEFFEKCLWQRKIWTIILKMYTNIIQSKKRTFGIEFGQNRLKRSNFFRFWIFWKYFLNCVTCANFELLRSYIHLCSRKKGIFTIFFWKNNPIFKKKLNVYLFLHVIF